jgi:hypothetical protein
LLILGRGDNGASIRTKRKFSLTLLVPITVTPFGAEFLVEDIIIVILGALLEILWGINFDASVVVIG